MASSSCGSAFKAKWVSISKGGTCWATTEEDYDKVGLGCLPLRFFNRNRTLRDSKARTKEYIENLRFLESIAFFRLQLPRDELPRLAGVVEAKIYQPGEMIQKRNDPVEGLYVVKSGSVSVLTCDTLQFDKEQWVLVAGDHWGARSLRKPRLADFSIKATEEGPVTLLLLTKKAHDSLGPSCRLKPPVRVGLYEGEWMKAASKGDATSRHSARPTEFQSRSTSLKQEELHFVQHSLEASVHTRAFVHPNSDALHKVAKSAVRRTVETGEVVARAGEVGHSVLIVEQGTFDSVPALKEQPAGCQQSAEHIVACERLGRRVQIRQQILQRLFQTRPSSHPQKLSSTQQKEDDNDARNGRLVSKSVRLFVPPEDNGSLESDEDTAIITSETTAPQSEGDLSSPETLQRRSRKNRTEGLHLGQNVQRLQMESMLCEEEPKWRPSRCEQHQSDYGFAVGDKVKLVISRLYGRTAVVGTVQEDLKNGRCIVNFPSPLGSGQYFYSELRQAQELHPAGTIGPGEAWGELSALYNAPYLTTLRAREPAVVYEIPLNAFHNMRRPNKRTKECKEILARVELLSGLPHMQLWELARSAETVVFEAGEVLVRENVEYQNQLWYVIEEGSCSVTQEKPDGSTSVLSVIGPGGTVGEWAILRDAAMFPFTVVAGPEGVRALAVPGDPLKGALRCNVMERSVSQEEELMGDPASLALNAEEYMKGRSSMVQSRQSRPSGPQAPSALQPITRLGKGAFGDVFLVEDGQGAPRRWALKRMDLQEVESHDLMEQVKTETEILAMTQSPFIVQFGSAFKDSNFIYVLMEAATGGNLFQMMCDTPELLIEDTPRGSSAMFYVGCISGALGYLHDRHVIYRDLKLENVLLNSRGYAQLCDMGFARFVLGKTTTLLGTPDYMAPELIEPPHAHDRMVDWWALGVLTHELITEQAPFETDDTEDECDNPWGHLLAIREQQRKRQTFPLIPRTIPLAKAFLKGLLTENPSQRLGNEGLDEVRNHAWFTASEFDFARLDTQSLPPPFVPPEKVYERKMEAHELFTPEGSFPVRVSDTHFAPL